MTIYRAGVNPALALHELWTTIALTMAGGEFRSHLTKNIWTSAEPWQAGRRRIMHFQLGKFWTCVEIEGFILDNYGNPEPVFSLGLRKRGYGITESFFVLKPDGTFAFRSPYGNVRRGILADGTFLDWSWTASRIRWYVSTIHQEQRYNLDDWRRPVPYVGKDVPGLARWWKLDPHETGWAMSPADPTDTKFGESFARDQQLRERRVVRAENAWRKSQGLAPKTGRTATLRTQNQTLDGEQAALMIAAVIDVNQPAQTTRLVRTRPVEATEGIH